MSKATFDPTKYVTANCQLDDVKRLKECFDVFDYDHSGAVSADQLINSVKALGIQDQAGIILNITDSWKKDEEIDFPTFLDVFGFGTTDNGELAQQQLFEVFDSNGQGGFGPDQFDKVAKSVGENFSNAECDQMIDYADKDRDGVINFEQFLDVINKVYPKI